MKRSRLKPVSNKRKVLNVEYEKSKRQWRKNHDGRCEMMLDLAGNPVHRQYRICPECEYEKKTGKASPIDHSCNIYNRCHRNADRNPHHSHGRGKFLCDISTFIGLCRYCHDWSDTHRKQAEALGYFTRVYDKH